MDELLKRTNAHTPKYHVRIHFALPCCFKGLYMQIYSFVFSFQISGESEIHFTLSLKLHTLNHIRNIIQIQNKNKFSIRRT